MYGRSVFHCPYCDGWEMRDQPIAIYGSGDRGVGLSLELTVWSHDRLYQLKGEIVAQGVKAVTGLDMPVFEKRRFQHGAVKERLFRESFPSHPSAYRRTFRQEEPVA